MDENLNDLKRLWIKEKRWELFLKYGPYYRDRMTDKEREDIQEKMRPVPVKHSYLSEDGLVAKSINLVMDSDAAGVTLLLLLLAPVIFIVSLLMSLYLGFDDIDWNKLFILLLMGSLYGFIIYSTMKYWGL